MSAWWLPALHAIGALVLACLPGLGAAAVANIAFAVAGLVLAVFLAFEPFGLQGLLHLDALNLPLLLVAAFVGATTAWFSWAMLPREGLGPRAGRAYHAAFQLFLGANHLALLSDNLALMWVAIEAATLATILMVGMQRSPAAIEAAWKFFVLCGVGIALALFGTVVLALAAQPLAAEGEALSFTALMQLGARADPGLLTLAFVFLALGYGTKAGLAPLHSWLPDAHAEGPMAISAVLSGLLLNAALHAVLRAKAVVGLNPAVLPPGWLLLGMGVLSLLLAALALWRRRDARRLFAWSSIEHMGLAAIGFGLGGPGALAGLLHLLGHSLVKSAIFFGLGRAIAAKGSQRLADLRGLAASDPALGWPLLVAVLAVAGLPPFSLFASEMLLVQQALAQWPILALPLLVGLLLAGLALLKAVQGLCLGPATPDVGPRGSGWGVLAPLWLHLLAALLLGMALPASLTALLIEGARIAG